ncbi:hypothetical protein Tco_1132536 [Tanacetum coccineum]|uniref:Uncharacterized protein n=1 Tax=Tanacetum coccineum TaxID=301880 RepID=A0ABQ5JC77_9ASTR
MLLPQGSLAGTCHQMHLPTLKDPNFGPLLKRKRIERLIVLQDLFDSRASPNVIYSHIDSNGFDNDLWMILKGICVNSEKVLIAEETIAELFKIEQDVKIAPDLSLDIPDTGWSKPMTGEVFHEVSESFQEESSSSSLKDDIQQSSEEVMVSPTNTQSISNNMVPNVNEASSSHNVFDERLEDAYFDAKGIDYDVTFAPVVELRAIRVFLAFVLIRISRSFNGCKDGVSQ